MDISDISKIVFLDISEKQDDACPVATKDIAVNLKNRQKAIDAAGYGPLNPREANPEFWKEKADRWDVTQADAKKQVCGNCAAFIKSERILKCINDGLSEGDTQDSWATIEAGELGYCEAFDFKCASKRTCDAWIVGGPITSEKPTGETPTGNEESGVEAKSAETAVGQYLSSLTDDELDILFPENEDISDYEAKWLFDVGGAFLRRSLTNRRRRRRRKSAISNDSQKATKKPVLRDPDGGLTPAGRKYFKKKEGANLRPGVKGPANTPLKMRRKGSFLVRFFTNPRGPLVDKNGQPTRLALSARAWGEPAPTTVEAAHKLAAKGRALLEKYRRYQDNAKKSDQPDVRTKVLGQTIGQRNQQSNRQSLGGNRTGGNSTAGSYNRNARDADGDGTIQEGTDYSRPADDKKK